MQEHTPSSRAEALVATGLDAGRANDNEPQMEHPAGANAVGRRRTKPEDRARAAGHLRVEADGRTVEFLVSDEEAAQLMELLSGVQALSQPEPRRDSRRLARSSTRGMATSRANLALTTTIALLSAIMMALVYVYV